MSVFEEEIDLRQYITAILQHWRLIILLGTITAIVAFLITFTQSDEFTATSTVLLTRSRTTLSLAEQFPTVAEPVDTRSRIDAILAIATSDAIAQNTLAKVEGDLEEDERELDNFKEMVSLRNEGDAIQITATAKDPDLAAQIANGWARESTLAINTAFSGEQPLTEIQSQLAIAQEEFDAAQSELEGFIQTNQKELLEQRIEEAQSLLDNLSNDRAIQIEYFTNRKQSMVAIINQAEGLRSQLEAGNNSAAGDIGDALSVLLARTNSLGIFQILSNDEDQVIEVGHRLEIQVTDLNLIRDTTSNYSEDLNLIIQQAKIEKQKAETSLETIALEIINNEGYQLIEDTAAQIRVLETEKEREEARERDLLGVRDLAWEAYQALTQKEAEIKNTAQTVERVTIASLAVPPSKPTSQGTILKTLIAGAMGVAIGLIWVVGSNWWQIIIPISKTESK
jgi:capsular polysaccharide biosynthesis protein